MLRLISRHLILIPRIMSAMPQPVLNVNEGEINSITSAMIVDGVVTTDDIRDTTINTVDIKNGAVTMAKINQEGATSGQVIKWTGSAWAPGTDLTDNAWVRSSPADSILYTIRYLGMARGGANNMLNGYCRYTFINFGVACTTGRYADYDSFCTIGGGRHNIARWSGATVAGGINNIADNLYATVAGGDSNVVLAYGGNIGGGVKNIITSNGDFVTICGGRHNTAGGPYSVISGWYNATSGSLSAIGGGYGNYASGYGATIPGGYLDTVAGQCGFATEIYSVVPADYYNSAAFNGQSVTASTQTRVGILSKTSGSFTIDHPLEPNSKILNHYFIEGPEMRNIYEGSVVLDALGKATVRLPDYFDALNRNPHIQLTGVGTSDVYVAEDVKGNQFVIGGKPGTKVYWQVTGERKDVSAEITRRLMPVEQLKTGSLAGRMLDDDFLVGCMAQLEREGKGQGINFRTAKGRQRYEELKRLPQKLEQELREKR